MLPEIVPVLPLYLHLTDEINAAGRACVVLAARVWLHEYTAMIILLLDKLQLERRKPAEGLYAVENHMLGSRNYLASAVWCDRRAVWSEIRINRLTAITKRRKIRAGG